MQNKSWVLGLILGSLVSSSAFALDDAQVSMIEANIDQGRVQDAVISLKRKLKASPRDKEARYLLAKAYLQKKDFASSEKELRRARKLGVDKSHWMPIQAEIYLYQQKFDVLLKEFDLSKIDYKDPTADWVKKLKIIVGEALLSKNRTKEAQESFQSVLTHDANEMDAWLGLTQTYLMQNKVNEAESTLVKAQKRAKRQVSLATDAQIEVMQAAIYRLKKDYDSARIAYLHALNLDENNLQARFGLTELYLLTKDRDAFLKQSEALYLKAPKHPLSLYYKGLAQYSTNDTNGAIETLEKLVRLNKRHASAHLLLGYSYYKQHRFEMAAKTLEQYMQMNPEHIGSQAVYAAVMLKLKEPGKTIKLLEPLVEQTPHFQWLALLGHAYVLKGDLDKGIDTLNKASNMMPQDPAIKVELAASLLANNELQKAEGLLDEVVSGNEYVQADLLRLFVALKNNDPEKAHEIGKALLVKDSKNPVYHNVFGLALKSLDKSEEAEKHFKIAIKKAPDFIAAMNNLAELYIQNNEMTQAIKLIDDVLKRHPNALRTLYLKSYIAEKQKNLPLAEKWLKTAQFRNPTNFEVVANLVSFYLRNKDMPNAYIEAKDGLKKFPKNPKAKHLVGQLALHQKDYDKAFTIYDELKSEYPENIQVLQGLARSQMGLNLVDKARVSIESILSKQQNNLPALLLSADIALVQKNYSQLEDVSKNILETYPENPIGAKLLADASLGLGHLKEALKYYKMAYDKAGTQHYAKSYYRALKHDKQDEEAIALLENHLKKYPFDNPLRQFLATEYLTNQQLGKAKIHYLKVVENNKRDFVSFNNLAHVYMQEKNLERAHELAGQAYKIQPNSPQVADTYAWTLIQLKKAEKAIPILTSAIKLTPDSIELRYHRAVGFYDAGQKDQAKLELEKIVSSEAIFPEKKHAKALLARIERQG